MDSDIDGRVRAFWEQACNDRDLDPIDAISDDVGLLRQSADGATRPGGGGSARQAQQRPTMRAAADGRLLEDGTPGYDEARAVWNAMVQRRPRAIVRGTGPRRTWATGTSRA